MDEITVENFRCFRERQTARLAPLTLLVGDNSTGKTSMMAIVRILWDVVCLGSRRPDFRDEPHDLGSFREIAHQSVNGDGQTKSFVAGIRIGDWKSEATFERGGISTEVRRLRIRREPVSVEWNRLSNGTITWEATTGSGSWFHEGSADRGVESGTAGTDSGIWGPLSEIGLRKRNLQPTSGSPSLSEVDHDELVKVALFPFRQLEERGSKCEFPGVPSAVVPVRSRSISIRDPGSGFHDPKGAGVAGHLAALAQSDKEQWNQLKKDMETYGRRTGIFDELRIRCSGDGAGSDLFRLQVRKHLGSGDGSWRNFVDVGYGANRILPLFLEFAHPEATAMLQLRQPEAHLHPSAQAGLGSILCEVAASGQQLMVETHSDHLMDRIRMDVRDRKTGLRPEDVSLLFFERRDDGVRIHNIEIDRVGNILNAPPGYRRFFMDEVNRSLGL